MVVRENVSLKKYHSFGAEAYTRYFAELNDISHFAAVQQKYSQLPLLILGGGSNVLFMEDFQGLVLRVQLKGISVEKETSSYVYVKAMAGESWEDFVEYCVNKGWGGIENLTLIPGNVGTSPMQNIGAYGVELKDTFHSLEALEIATGRIHTFFTQDCQFGYRESFFKKEGKGRYVIVSVCFRLTKKNHLLNTHYGAVKQELEKQGIKNPGISEVMRAIQQIRRSKLPDPNQLGNAGSFFKNPMLETDLFERIAARHPDLPSYKDETGSVKTAAGWLIEQAGWKGFREGDAGVHHQQALVLVNFGQATGKQIYALAMQIQQSVLDKFGILLEPEVNIIGQTP